MTQLFKIALFLTSATVLFSLYACDKDKKTNSGRDKTHPPIEDQAPKNDPKDNSKKKIVKPKTDDNQTQPIDTVYKRTHTKIIALSGGFAALKLDGSVWVWGTNEVVDDFPTVADTLSSGVVDIVTSTGSAVAALKKDGSVIVWGYKEDVGDMSRLGDSLKSGVKKVAGNNHGFDALKDDGSVVSWNGDSHRHHQLNATDLQLVGDHLFARNKNGDIIVYPEHQDQSVTKNIKSFVRIGLHTILVYKDGNYGILTPDWNTLSPTIGNNVSSTVSSYKECSGQIYAITKNGTVVPLYTDKPSFLTPEPSIKLTNVKSINCNRKSTVFLYKDGTISAWATAEQGADYFTEFNSLTDIEAVKTLDGGYAAIYSDGSVVTAGGSHLESYLAEARDILEASSKIFINEFATVALHQDGSADIWGVTSQRNAIMVDLPSNVKEIIFDTFAYAAVMKDNTVVTWGLDYKGGDSSEVADNLNN